MLTELYPHVRAGLARTLQALLAVGAASVFAGGAAAETMTLVAANDATLIQDPVGGLANGSGINLFVGRIGPSGGATLRRGLIRFDLSALPPQAQIQSVSVRISLTRSRFAGDLPVTLHRLTQSWSEGPSASAQGIGEPSVNGDVTWIHRTKPSVLWSQPGGDYVGTASASRIVGATGGPYVWSSTAGLIADVQQWADNPAANHGWIVIGFEGSGTSAKGFSARETSTPADRPTMTVEYTAPVIGDNDVPLPAWAIALLAFGMAASLVRNRRF